MKQNWKLKTIWPKVSFATKLSTRAKFMRLTYLNSAKGVA